MTSQSSNSLQHDIFQSLPTGVIVFGADAAILAANKKAAQIFGLSPAELNGKKAGDFAMCFVERDGASLDSLQQPFSRVFFSRQPTGNLELGIIRPGADQPFPVLVHGIPEISPQGELLRAVITLTEIAAEGGVEVQTLAKNGEYGDIFEHMTEGVAYCRMIFDNGRAVDWTYLAVNQAFITLTGLKNVVGKRVSQVIPGIRETDAHLFEVYSRVALTGRSEKFETLVASLKAWLAISVYSPKQEYFVTLFDVITDRKNAELEREKLLLESRRNNALLSADMAAMQWLHDLGSLFLKDGNLQEILVEVVDAAISISGADFGNIQLLEPHTKTLRIIAHRNFPQWWIDYWNKVAVGQGACSSAIQKEARVIIEDIEQSPIFCDSPSLEQQRQAGIRAVQSTPLCSRSGRLIGMFSTHYRTPHRFSERTLQLIDLLARHAADIIDRAQSDAALLLSQVRLGLAMKAANAGFWQWNLQTNEHIWSEDIWQVYGLAPHSVRPSYEAWLATIHPDDRDAAEQVVGKAIRTASDLYAEWRVLQTNGTERWIMSQGRPEKNGLGKVVSYNGIVVDISRHKQIERELLASKAKLEAALASMTDAVVIADIKGNFVHLNDAFAHFHKFRHVDECAKTLAEYSACLDVYDAEGDQVPIDQWAMSRALRGETATNEEYRLSRKDTGETWIASYSFAPICIKAGDIVGAVVVGRDISASKEAEFEKLRRLKDRYRAIVMDQNDLIVRFDPEGRITFVNDAYCRTFGVYFKEVIGTVFLPDIYPEDIPLVQGHFKGLTKTKPYRSIEHRVYLPNGELRWQQWSGRVIFDDVGEIVEYQAVGRDITSSKQMKKKLEEELQLRQLFMDALPGIAMLVRYETREVMAANKAANTVGIIPGQPCFTWLQQSGPCSWCLAPKLWENGLPQHCRILFRDIYWDAHWVPVDGDHLYLHYLFDVTAEEQAKLVLLQTQEELEARVKERTLELQKSHAQLLHSEKLAVVGSLSASIAHEFNNPLQSVMTVLKGLPQYVTLPAKEQELVALAVQECVRMKNLIADLREFYRPTTNQPSLVNINLLLDGLLLISQQDFHSRRIQVKKHFTAELPMIIAVVDQLKQVFLNLLNNASYACKNGGVITIATEETAQEIVVRIQDTGLGISEVDLPHIFEPFFTTKPESKGTGLGLSVSFGIIKTHGGQIEVTSKIGEGSIFSVFLPKTSE